MMRSKTAATVGVFLVAIALSIVVAVPASAARPKLVLTWEGAPSSVNETGVALGAGTGTCRQIYAGTATNDAPKIVDTIEETIRTLCEEPTYSFTGGFSKVTLAATGLVKAYGSVQIASPGPCVYRFTSPVATLPLSAGVFAIVAKGTAVGMLVKTESSLSCAAGEVLPLEISLEKEIPEINTPAFEGELR